MYEDNDKMNSNMGGTQGTENRNNDSEVVQTTAFTMVDSDGEEHGTTQNSLDSSESSSANVPVPDNYQATSYYDKPIEQHTEPIDQTRYQEERTNRQQTENHYDSYYQIPNEEEIEKPKKKQKKGRKAAGFIAKAAAFGLIAGGMFLGVNQVYDTFFSGNTKNAQPLIATTSTATNSKTPSLTVTDVSDIVEEVMPSIVSVVSRVSTGNPYTGYGFFFGIPQEYDSSGSGFIVGQSETELLIATNNHVVNNAKTITVTFTDKTPENPSDDVSVQAILKGASSENDLAVIAIPLENIPQEVISYIKVATLGNSDELKVGEGTIAIGNALGYGQSVTTGCVSALNRQVTLENLAYSAIQTDAAINEGNSGGALLNMKGEVIGINSAKLASSSVEGMGYAIPISSAMDIINELMNRKTRSVVEEANRGYLGISGVDISRDYSRMYGIPSGISIQTVEKGSPADKAGIQKYDIITKFDGQTVSSIDELEELIQYYEKGETITVTVEYAEGRNQYKETELEVTLGERKR